jgi:hypothetical protein
MPRIFNFSREWFRARPGSSLAITIGIGQRESYVGLGSVIGVFLG